MSNIAIDAVTLLPTGIIPVASTRARDGARVPYVPGPLVPGRAA
ncbi:hypothetical protein [uncultured Amnibacterium sp.]